MGNYEQLRTLLGGSIEVDIPLPSEQDFIDAANHVLWYATASEGLQPGSFVQRLIHTMMCADEANVTKLSLGFPALAVIVDDYRTDGDGALEKMRTLIAKTSTN